MSEAAHHLLALKNTAALRVGTLKWSQECKTHGTKQTAERTPVYRLNKKAVSLWSSSAGSRDLFTTLHTSMGDSEGAVSAAVGVTEEF